MKIQVKQLSEDSWKENDYEGQFFEILIDGKSVLYVSDGGEPEDNSLSRDLNFIYDIPDLLEKIYEIGKNGEELEIEYIYE